MLALKTGCDEAWRIGGAVVGLFAGVPSGPSPDAGLEITVAPGGVLDGPDVSSPSPH
jgi:hypothetical protein